jgi:hypothetical protein
MLDGEQGVRMNKLSSQRERYSWRHGLQRDIQLRV